MQLLSTILQIDYKISSKLANTIAKESIIRRFLQVLTITGTAFTWFFGPIIVAIIFPSVRLEALTLIFVIITVVIPVYFLKHTVKRERPVFKDTRGGVTAFDEWSFPSGHASRSTYIVILMSIYFPKTTILWIIWAILIVMSRLLLGVHYFSDIIAGILVTLLDLFILFELGLLPILPIDLSLLYF